MSRRIARAFNCCLATILLVGAMVSLEASPPLDDATIIGIYNQVNSFDIEAGLLGMQLGHTEAVRTLGQMVSTDHTGVRLTVSQLASDIGVTPVLPASRNQAAKAHYKAMAALRSQSAQAFDRAYLLHEIQFHQAAIQAIKDRLLPAANHKNCSG